MNTITAAAVLALTTGGWVEQSGPRPQAALDAHLNSGLVSAAPLLLPVNGVSWWLGVSRRDGAAFYVIGPEDAPGFDFVKTVEAGDEPRLGVRLIELRWRDPKDGRRRRWYDESLARRLGWTTDGRGRPSETPRPIPLPDADNELF